MSTIKNGKKPLSARAKPMPVAGLDDIFGNTLGVNPEILDGLAEKGLAHRWINAKRLADMGGYHPRGWRPIRTSELPGYDKMDSHSLAFGSDPGGYIRRGDNILAVRPMETNQKHKAYLKQQAAAMSHSKKSKAQAEELKEYVKRAGLDATVLEGFEDEKQ